VIAICILAVGCVLPFLAYYALAAFVVVKHPSNFAHMGKLHPNRFFRRYRWWRAR
jgi:hypothetical protein